MHPQHLCLHCSKPLSAHIAGILCVFIFHPAPVGPLDPLAPPIPTHPRPCPYCASSKHENLDAAERGGRVLCVSCGAAGPDPDRLTRHLVAHTVRTPHPADGIDAWDTRLTPDQLIP